MRGKRLCYTVAMRSVNYLQAPPQTAPARRAVGAWLTLLLVVLLLAAPLLVCDEHWLVMARADAAMGIPLSSPITPALPSAPICLAHCLTHNLLLGTPTLLAVLALARTGGAAVDVSLRSRLGLPPLLPPPQFV
jgi:hypothetical protein